MVLERWYKKVIFVHFDRGPIRGRLLLGTYFEVGKMKATNEQDHAHPNPLVIQRANTSANLSSGSVYAPVAR